jgi:DNA ligase (NAD+)
MKATEFLEKLKVIGDQDVAQTKGVGPVLAQNLSDFVHSPRFTLLLQDFSQLERTGIELNIISPQLNTKGSFSGKTVCITGEFAISRNEIKKLIEQEGGKVVSAVSKHTSLLLAGEKAGSKLAKARELGISILEDYTQLFL